MVNVIDLLSVRSISGQKKIKRPRQILLNNNNDKWSHTMPLLTNEIPCESLSLVMTSF